jgi:hypothetical protein
LLTSLGRFIAQPGIWDWNVRLIGWLLLIMVVVGWLASELPPAATPPSRSAGQSEDGAVRWRRTSDGWQDSSRWVTLRPTPRPAVHPAVIALLEVSLTLAAMIALGDGRPSRAR